ncbi:TspO protein [archaeon CG06_land_8_20_14_3_00_37_11]|nr:MAG: TspO protein [archaeon CG06_land_8_20_14_3_00_37_11]
MKVNWRRLLISLLIVFLAGFIGSYFTYPGIQSWYAGLNKPAIAPPNWLFAPVWSALYVLMAFSFYFVWNKSKVNNKVLVNECMTLFIIQLVLNSLWSIIFFGLHNISLALVEILVLWSFLFLTIVKFYKIDKKSAYLLIPYILWVSFAALLNYSFMAVN